jgi:hypothetical protein
MPQTPHIERHFTAGETVRDIVSVCRMGSRYHLRWLPGSPVL